MSCPQRIRWRAHREAIPAVRPTLRRYHPHLPTFSGVSELAATGLRHDRHGSAHVDRRCLRIDVDT